MYKVILSTHDLTRRSTHVEDISFGFYHFQLTTSHGGRQDDGAYWGEGWVFQLTTSHGGRPQPYLGPAFKDQLSTHDLTRRSTLEYYTTDTK